MTINLDVNEFDKEKQRRKHLTIHIIIMVIIAVVSFLVGYIISPFLGGMILSCVFFYIAFAFAMNKMYIGIIAPLVMGLLIVLFTCLVPNWFNALLFLFDVLSYL
ncbi:MAG: hypothetical protein ACFFCS_09480 [Candidatus Hodarchaeota archaeon]